MPVNETQLQILRTVHRSNDPLPGRRVAAVTGLAPNTVNRALATLEELGAVIHTVSGKSRLWTATPHARDLLGRPESASRVALVVTAVSLEHEAVRSCLLNTARERVENLSMVKGELPGVGTTWTIHLAQAGMGNASAAALVALAAGQLQANVVAFVGTAGGLRPKEQHHGDVVIASLIHNAYAGKQVPDGQGNTKFLSRGRTYNVPAPLLSLVHSCINDSSWTPTRSSEHYNARGPHAYVKPIAAVEAVQGDPGAPLMDDIREHFQDAVALDMESYGLAAGSDVHDLPVLVVRGISDFLGDKTHNDDEERQPRAARNAARMLMDILAQAHPDDFRRGTTTAPDPTPPTNTPLPKLPESAAVWEQRLRRRSSERADAALTDLQRALSGGGTAATWLNRALHRPPMWLRDDDSGDGWALAGALGDLAESTVTGRAFQKAADTAGAAGEQATAAYFSLMAAIREGSRPITQRTASRQVGRAETTTEDDRKRAAAVLDALPANTVATLGPLVEFYRSFVTQDPVVIKRAGEDALAFLGHRDTAGVLRRDVQNGSGQVLDQEISDLAAGTVLIHLARIMLAPGAAEVFGVATGLSAGPGRGNPVTGDLADDSYYLATWALKLRPESLSAQLTQAQALLAVLLSTAGRPAIHTDSTEAAMLVERQCLEVRDAFRLWNGEAGPAVAVAARARELQGDAIGALRLTQPAPDGLATRAEASHPEAVRVGAHLAARTGQTDLALALIAQVEDRAESHLLRGAVLAERPGMGHESEEAYAAALALADGRQHVIWQALQGLIRRGGSLAKEHQTLLDQELNDLEQRDSALADLLRARAALIQGDPQIALELARRHPESELGLELRTQALSDLGRGEEAVELMVQEATRRGDVLLSLEALRAATHHRLLDQAHDIGQSILTTNPSFGVQAEVLRAVQHIARLKGDWAEVAKWSKRIIDEARAADRPVPENQWWFLAEALYFTERYADAVTWLVEAPALTLDSRDRVRLLFSSLQLLFYQRRENDPAGGVNDLGGPAFDLFLRAASEWSHDEQLAAFALNIAMTAPNATLTEAQLVRVRALSEQYFEQHGEEASIRRLSVEDDNFDELIEVLKASAPRAEALQALSEHVITGRLPLSHLTQWAGRSYAESLIRKEFRAIIALGDDGELGTEAARKALSAERVVVDTSALVAGPLTGAPLRHLTSKFDTVHLHPVQRRDIERAKANLAMHSTGSMGWDSRTQQSFITETTDEEAAEWSACADELWRHIALFDASDRDTSGDDEFWNSPIMLAHRNGIPLWADDLALRNSARSMGIPAFSTFDLIRVTADDDTVARAFAALFDNQVVDLPIHASWNSVANEGGWDLKGPLALAISRPFAWRDINEGFDEFQALVRLRPAAMPPGELALWAHLACVGLALSLPSQGRHELVSYALVWTIINADPLFTDDVLSGRALKDIPEGAGIIAENIFRVAAQLRERFYPDVDEVGPMVQIVADILRSEIGPEQTARFIVSLAGALTDELRKRVMTAFLRDGAPS